MGVTREQIIANTEVDPVKGCWLWTGSLNNGGYGNMPDRKGMAHREAYKLWKGEIPEKAQIHHRCGVKRCVCPDHLVAVTRNVNQWLNRAERHGAMSWEHLRQARLLHGLVGKRSSR